MTQFNTSIPDGQVVRLGSQVGQPFARATAQFSSNSASTLRPAGLHQTIRA
jgi:hypothetical protein